MQLTLSLMVEREVKKYEITRSWDYSKQKLEETYSVKENGNDLDAQEISYTERHIVEENPTYEELKKWQARSGLPIKKFFNTSGMLYKEMQLKDKLPQMSEDEQLKLLATNGMLVKRPVIVDGDTVLTGFREKEWEEKLR